MATDDHLASEKPVAGEATSSGSSITTATPNAAPADHNHTDNHGIHLHLPHVALPHRASSDHGHHHPHTHHHTVIHAIRTPHPPHTHASLQPRKHLIARPRARQYFTENGDLHKQCDDGVPRQAGKFELFLDLLYIGLVANFAEDMIHNPTSGAHLAKYVLIFVPAWRIWTDLMNTMNQYYNDDLVQRVLIVWIMILMLLYGNNAIYIDVSLDALRVSVGAFITARASIAVTTLYYSITVYQHAIQLRIHSLIVLSLLPLWTPLFLPDTTISTRLKIGLAVLAFTLDQLSGTLAYNPFFTRFFAQPYKVALDIDHHADRMSAFFIIVLGEFLYGLVWASPAALDGVGAKSGRAAMSLVIAFCLCWLYTSCDGSRDNPESGVHALRWRAANGLQWVALHLPLSAALLISGDICAVFVKYGDDAGKPKSSFPTPADWQPLRWLFCGGLAVGVACLYWIALLHHEADEDPETRCVLFMPQWLRRLPRLPVAVVIACLPLAEMRITALMAVVTALLGFVLVWEMIGGMGRRWTWIEGGKRAFWREERAVVIEDEMVVGDEKIPRRDNDQSVERGDFEEVRNGVVAREGAGREGGKHATV
ncbi:bacterial low temperature requirement A protein-domain-containing protein [Geopyxis carbonaria]|nr:bacterial low temperature requirement A protein-domain-containing protein [Geopyxis carbonaria]